MVKLFLQIFTSVLIFGGLAIEVSASGGNYGYETTGEDVSIISITSNRAGDELYIGDSLQISVMFSEPVLFEDGRPFISLAPVNENIFCTVPSMPTLRITCSYTVEASDIPTQSPLEVTNFNLNGGTLISENGDVLNTNNLFSGSTPNLYSENILLVESDPVPIPVPDTDFTDEDVIDESPSSESNNLENLRNFALVGVILILIFFTYLVLRKRGN